MLFFFTGDDDPSTSDNEIDPTPDCVADEQVDDDPSNSDDDDDDDFFAGDYADVEFEEDHVEVAPPGEREVKTEFITKGKEYNDVLAHIDQHGGNRDKIISVKRIFNVEMYERFERRLRVYEIIYGCDSPPRVAWFFRCVKFEDIEEVSVNGFKLEEEGSIDYFWTFENGLWLSKSFSYSYDKAVPDAEGNKYIILCGAAIGKKIDRVSHLNVPDNINLPRHDYDTGCDDCANTNIIILFHKDACQPQYIISVKP